MMTITSVGFGDIAATPHNAPEQVTLTIMMLLCSLVSGNVIATFCGVMATLSRAYGRASIALYRRYYRSYVRVRDI